MKTTVLLKDMKDFPAVNAVYAEFFREDPPARATFQVSFPHLYQTILNHSHQNITFFFNKWFWNNCNLRKVGALPRDASVEVEAVAMVGTVCTSIIIVIDGLIDHFFANSNQQYVCRNVVFFVIFFVNVSVYIFTHD